MGREPGFPFQSFWIGFQMGMHPNRQASLFPFLVALNAWLEHKVRLSTQKKNWQVAFAVLLNMYDSFPHSGATIPFQSSILLHLLSRYR